MVSWEVFADSLSQRTLMFRPFETITDLAAGTDALVRRRHGVIEIVEGRLRAVRLRPFGTRAALWRSWLARLHHRRRPGDRCLLYYDQIGPTTSFLAIKLLVSGRGTSLKSVFAALDVLEEIACRKGTHALLADVSNERMTPRLLARLGWHEHAPMRWHRNYIKRLDRRGDLTLGLEEALREPADVLATVN